MENYLPLLRNGDVPSLDSTEEELFEFAMSINGYFAAGSLERCFRVRDRVLSLIRSESAALASDEELRLYLFGEARSCRHCCSPLPRREFGVVLDQLRMRAGRASPVRPSFTQFVFDSFVLGLKQNDRLIASLLPRIAPEYGVVIAAVDGTLSFNVDVQMEGTLHEVSKIDLIVSDNTSDPLACEFKVLWPNGEKECLDKTASDFDKLSAIGGLVVVFAYAVTDAPELHKKRRAPKALSGTIEAAERRFGPPTMRSGVEQVTELRQMSGEWELLAWKVENPER